MRVLLVRHAQAVDPYLTWGDHVRWLTEEGRRTMKGVTGTLEELGLRWDRIFTSPLTRAVQTAEILAAPAWFEGSVEVHAPLSPDEGTTALALAPLERVTGDGVVALVGHEPRIRVMAGQLLGVDAFPAFRPAGTCLVRWTPGAAGQLEWRMDPDARTPERGALQGAGA
jgi:phosphohistidine phosphatase